MPNYALVTGAAGALGEAVVARFLAGGGRVFAVDASAERLAELAARLGDPPALAHAAADLTDAGEVARAFDAAEAAGGRPPDAVVHLVGGFRWGRLADLADEDWRFLVSVNLDTTFQVLRESARRFERAGGGALVAVSAPAAFEGAAGVGAYAATKAAVLRLVESLARELAPLGGRANAVLPGTMDTPANRRAMPDEDPARWVSTAAVAAQIHYLTTAEAAAINGAALRVPGPAL